MGHKKKRGKGIKYEDDLFENIDYYKSELQLLQEKQNVLLHNLLIQEMRATIWKGKVYQQNFVIDELKEDNSQLKQRIEKLKDDYNKLESDFKAAIKDIKDEVAIMNFTREKLSQLPAGIAYDLFCSLCQLYVDSPEWQKVSPIIKAEICGRLMNLELAALNEKGTTNMQVAGDFVVNKEINIDDNIINETNN